MLTKVPNSNCFSRALTFFGLLIILPILTLSSQASSAADHEQAPLLGNRHGVAINEQRVARDHVAVHLEDRVAGDHVAVNLEEGQNVVTLQQYLAGLNVNDNSAPLDAIAVAAALLVRKETTTAEAEMNKVATYMYYVKDEDYHEQIIAEAEEGGDYVENSESFEQLLLDRAFKAATEGPLTNYLQELNTAILTLQRVAPQLQDRITELNRRVTLFVQAIEIIKQKESESRLAHQRALDEQKRKVAELQATKRRLWIAVPVVGVLAFLAGGGLATLFVHLYWR